MESQDNISEYKYGHPGLQFMNSLPLPPILNYTPLLTPLDDALTQVRAWMDCPFFSLIGETEEVYYRYLQHLLEASQVVGPRIHDAGIAAICLSHGVDELWSADRDFSRFPGLTVRNPLQTDEAYNGRGGPRPLCFFRS